MKLPKTENAEHEQPGVSPWPAVLNLAAGILLGWLPLLFARGTEAWFTDAPAVWIYSLAFVISITSLGIAIGLGAARNWSASSLRWMQTVVLLGAGATMPLLPTRSMIMVAPPDPGLEFLRLLLLKAGLVTFALGAFIGVRLARRDPGERGPDLATLIGFLVGQLAFLVVLMPALSASQMNIAFSSCVLAFAVAAVIFNWRSAVPATDANRKKNRLRAAETRELWLTHLLAAAIVMLTLVISARVMSNLVSDPKLWAIPVLITVVAFAAGRLRPALQNSMILFGLQSAGAAALTANLYLGSRWSPGVLMEILYLSLAVCVIAAGAAIGRQANKPGAPSASGWTFMAMLAGAAAVTVVAEKLSPTGLEFPATIIISTFLVWRAVRESIKSKALVIGGTAGLLVLVTALVANVYLRSVNVVGRVRSFYGITQTLGMGAGAGAYRIMLDGDTPRGMQFLAADVHFEPTLFHGRNTGIDLLFRSLPKGNYRRVGVIGVGNGDLVAYAAPSDNFRFYEFDPGAISTAENEFTYLPEARRRDFGWKLITGAPRLTLDQETDDRFDVLILDVFDSGPVPVHLLTREAFAVWRKQLAPDGVLAINLTNNRFNLLPVVWRQAIEDGLTLVPVFTKADPKTGAAGADWVFLTSNAELLRKKAFLKPKEADIAQARQFPIWTDDTCQPLSVLK